MGIAREVIEKHKKESELTPNWTAVWDLGLIYFTEEEIEKVIRELNENCKEGWE